MVVSVESLLIVAKVVTIILFIVAMVGRLRSKEYGWYVAKIIILASLIAVNVWSLTVHCLTGKSYGVDLLMINLWVLNLVSEAFTKNEY